MLKWIAIQTGRSIAVTRLALELTAKCPWLSAPAQDLRGHLGGTRHRRGEVRARGLQELRGHPTAQVF